jgi:hypothetical protein
MKDRGLLAQPLQAWQSVDVYRPVETSTSSNYWALADKEPASKTGDDPFHDIVSPFSGLFFSLGLLQPKSGLQGAGHRDHMIPCILSFLLIVMKHHPLQKYSDPHHRATIPTITLQ